jgi:hypothetical protein
MIFFNVVLAYGMETSFLGFFKEPNKKGRGDVDESFLDHYFILVLALLFRDNLAESLIDSQYITYTIWIPLDALVIIPFSKLRVNQKPMVYAAIKIGSVLVNLILSVVFLLSPCLLKQIPMVF